MRDYLHSFFAIKIKNIYKNFSIAIFAIVMKETAIKNGLINLDPFLIAYFAPHCAPINITNRIKI